MGKYNEKISDNSLWLTATPSTVAMTLPFYITETGHFNAERDYVVERNKHGSYLLIYTVNGAGKVITSDTEIAVNKNCAVVIDCRKYHKYFSVTDEWEFFWVHFNGSAAQTLFDILYQRKEYAIIVNDTDTFSEQLKLILANTKNNNISGSIETSLKIHDLFRILVNSAMENEQQNSRKEHEKNIAYALKFIKSHYSENITVDDIIREIHISKYHFIRLFSRVMGVTPYNYLTAYRINMSKILLRTTDKSVSEIAEDCGFADTSNFINHFKKHTGQRPMQYRRDFT